jgi:predicted nucleic acid-binding protein
MWPDDAAYVALAEGLDADLVSLDGKIETIPRVMCSVRNLTRTCTHTYSKY